MVFLYIIKYALLRIVVPYFWPCIHCLYSVDPSCLENLSDSSSCSAPLSLLTLLDCSKFLKMSCNGL